ncbi:hypothetical protein EDD21DRAFT_384639, partial [Dissophora ornata]
MGATFEWVVSLFAAPLTECFSRSSFSLTAVIKLRMDGDVVSQQCRLLATRTTARSGDSIDRKYYMAGGPKIQHMEWETVHANHTRYKKTHECTHTI